VEMMETIVRDHILHDFYKARMENRQKEFLHPSYQHEQKLLTAIQLGNRKEAITALNEINQLQRAKLASTPLRSLKNSLICSCTLFTRAIIRGGVDPDTAYNLSDVIIQQIEKFEDYNKLQDFEVKMVHTFIDTLEKEHLNRYSSIVNKAISYIHNHILQDLSLQSIAKELYVSPSYLSDIFRKETGTTLIEFINRKKIEESKYFLLHTDLPLSQISSLFQFCNQSYYTYLFKKFTGVTPKKFQEISES
jgi:two-component system, response regulator YesN